MKELPFAEDIGHYWKTGMSSPEVWIEKATKLIQDIGGVVTTEAYGASQGRAAFMLAFRIDNDDFKVVFPLLPSRSGNVLAAKRQAATLLHHDIKAKCMTAAVLGNKAAFFSYLMLPDGRAASELATPELTGAFPLQLEEGAK